MNKTTTLQTKTLSRRSCRWRRVLPVLLLAFIGVCLFLPDAFAYQVKRVIRGVTNMSTSIESATVNISAKLDGEDMVPERCWIIATKQTNSDDRRISDILATVDDGQNITLNRRTSGVTLNVEWMVVEFFSGVTVTSGVTIVPDNSPGKTITIPSVQSTSKAFVYLSTRTNFNDLAADEAAIFGVRLLSPTQLRLERGQQTAGNGTANADVGYQIITFDVNDQDVSIQHGMVTINNSGNGGEPGEVSDNGVTLVASIPTTVTMNKAFLSFTTVPNDGVGGYERYYSVDGRITATNQITFIRGANSSSVQVWWSVIQIKNDVYGIFTNHARVSSSSSSPVSIGSAQGFSTPVAEKRSFALLSASGPSSTSTGRLDEISYTGQLNNNGATPPKSDTYTVDRSSSRTDTSNIAAEIAEFPPLRLISPIGGETWKVGDPVTITWHYADELKADGGGTAGVHRIKIELTTNGTDYYTIADNVDVDTGTLDNIGSYPWTVKSELTDLPNTIGEDIKIRISDSDLSDAYCGGAGLGFPLERRADQSYNGFIIKGVLTVAEPPDTWKIGETQNITWTYKGKLSLLAGPDNTVTIAINPGDGWINIITDRSVGTDGTGEADGSGSYPWTIPSGLPVASPTKNLIGEDNRVRVTLNYNPDPVAETLVEDESGVFTLTGQISSVTRDPDETWLLGQSVTVRWQKKGFFGSGVSDGNVKVYYSPTGVAPWTLLTNVSGLSAYPVPAGTDAGGGSVTWAIPFATQTSNPVSRIKIEQDTDSDVSAESADFSLKPSMTFNEPMVTGTVWRIGESHDIKWTPHGSIGTIVIKYAFNEDWPNATTIITRAAGTADEMQTQQWTVANPIGLNARIRIEKQTDPNIYAQSAIIHLKPILTLTSPTAGSTIEVTEPAVQNTQTVAWSFVGGITGTADIALSTDETGDVFGTAVTTNTVDINNLTGNKGSYDWVVAPSHVGAKRVRVAWHSDPDTTLVTGSVAHSGVFKTIEYLKFKSPNTENQSYEIGDEIYIQWTPYPADDSWDVNVRYSTQSGADGTFTGVITVDPVAANNIPSGGSDIGYKWTIPSATGIIKDTVRLQVSADGKEDDVHSEGLYNFKIKGKLTLTGESNGAEPTPWCIGDEESITWTGEGDIGPVSIMFAKDGESFSAIYTGFSCTGLTPTSYSWPWTIPGTAVTGDLNTAAKFKIQAQNNSSESLPSATPVSIRAKIYGIQPSSGATVFVSDTDAEEDYSVIPISWQTNYPANVPQIKLKLYNPKTAGWEDINNGDPLNNAQSPGSFNLWEVPNAIGDTALIKVYSASANGDVVFGDSASAFKIKGKFRIDAPTAADVGASALKVHDAALPYYKTVIWKNCGDIGTAKLYFSANGGAYQWVADLSGANGVKTYNWYPPASWNGANTIGTTNKLKITAAGDESVVYKESANFEIKGQLHVTQPNGQIYAIGPANYIPIEWDYAGDLGNIDIWFSPNGSTWEKKDTIDAGYTQPYNLLVPDAPTTTAYIRLEQVSDATVTSTTIPFRIRGDITNVQVYNTPWKVNEANHRITWDRTGAIQNVNIKLDTASGGGGYPITVSASAPNGGEFLWTIPSGSYEAVTSDTCRIRIRDALDATVEAVLDSDFAIKPVIWITHPQSQADSWLVGSSRNITWDYAGKIDYVKIQFSDDNGAHWYETAPYLIDDDATASDKSLGWTIPDKMSNQCLMRITDTNDATVTDDSNSAFSIKPVIVVNQPTGGAIKTNTSYTIQWTTTGTLKPLGTVKIDYTLDGDNWNTISGAAALESPIGIATFNWPISVDLTSAAAKVRVVANDDGAIVDESAEFRLEKLELLAPNGGEHWAAGIEHTITWTSAQVGTVRASYQVGTGSWTVIGTEAGATASLSWTIDADQTVSQDCRVKLEDLNYSSVSVVSATPFDIMAYLNVTDPIGGQPVVANTPYTIKWDKYGANVPIVILEYSKTPGNWISIKADAPNSGSYNWNPVPNDGLSDTAQIRITDPNNSLATDTGSNFWIKGEIFVDAPSGTESWNVGTSHDVAWHTNGAIPQVNLYYSPDNGSTGSWISIGTDTASPFSWGILPGAPLTTIGKIKVEDAAFPTVSGISLNNFEIKGNIFGVTPSGGVLNYTGAGSLITVGWDYQGTIANVEVFYSNPDGQFPPYPQNKLGEAVASTRTKQFAMPTTMSPTMRVRVQDKTNQNVKAESASTFAIKGGMTITRPLGTDKWLAGSTQNVQWTPTGSYLGTVKIEYSTTGNTPGSWTTIATPGAGLDNVPQSAEWNPLPQVLSADCYVRLSTQADPLIDVVVDSAKFKIIGEVSNFVSPSGSPVWNVGDTNRNIIWNAVGPVTPVAIYYNNNVGGGWVKIIDNLVAAAGPNTYPWPSVPDEKTEACQIRVYHMDTVNFPEVTNTSGNFSIRPQITVSAPATGANVAANSSGVPIRWSITGSQVSSVNVQYSSDGTNWFDVNDTNPVQASLGTSYTWNGVPSVRTSTMRIRVVDVDNSSIVGQSGLFNVVGSLQLSVPNGGQHWYVGTNQTISWQSWAVNTVDAYYSLTGGVPEGSWTYIASAAGSAGSIPWNLPTDFPVSNNVMVKVVDQGNSSVSDTSELPFEIIAVFDVQHPEAGDVLYAETPYLIQWDNTRSTGVTKVYLEYSTQGGADGTWNFVETSGDNTVDNDGFYSWNPVPANALSMNCKLKVRDVNNPLAVAVSEGTAFRIKSTLTLTSPTTGSESWGAGTPHDITWTKLGDINTIQVEYSPNEGLAGSWQTIATGVPAVGVPADSLKWTWNIPAGVTLTTKGRIRITVEGVESDVTSSSVNNFEIKGTLTLNTPNGLGISLPVNDSYLITWDQFGAISMVQIFLSTDGASYPVNPFVEVDVSGPVRSYSWQPDINSISKTCKIKIRDKSNISVGDESENLFEIKGKVVLNSPSSTGIKWFYNEPAEIRWTPTGNYAQVKLEYSLDNFGTAGIPIATVDAGVSGVQQTYPWSQVTIPISETARIRVSDPNSPSVQATSANDFSVRGRLRLIIPNGTEVWTVGTKHFITWTTLNGASIPKVDLSYSVNAGAFTPIVTNIDNTGSYEWNILTDMAISDNVVVKVADTRYPLDTDVSDVSDAPFKTVAGITLTAPVGNEEWGVGTKHNITWTPQGDIPSVDITYSDGVTPNIPVITGWDGNSGAYEWTIPNNPNITSKVKVMDVRKPDTVFAVSPENFSIVGSLTVLLPAPGAQWIVGNQKEITWTTNGTLIPRVKILLSLDGGTEWVQITDNGTGGSHFWDIPQDYCTPTARIKIIDYNNSRVSNEMTGNFKLQAQFSVTSPTAGQMYGVGDNCPIAWSTLKGVVNYVKLQYKSGSANWVVIRETLGNSGNFGWPADDAISTNVIIRVSDVDDDTAYADSGAFVIHGKVALEDITTGTVWIAETPVTINWNITGTIAQVDLAYSATGGEPYSTTIASGVTATNGTASWTAPQHVTATARVKISETGGLSIVKDESPVFTVRGSVTVVQPNGPTAQWMAGSPHNITWTRTGDFTNVKITLSSTGGEPYGTVIINSWSAAGGTYPWGIPSDFTLGTTYKVKIADANDETNVFDVSDANFSIIGSLTMVNPNVGGTWYVDETQNIEWQRNGGIAYIGIDISTNGFADDLETATVIAQTDATGTPSGTYRYPWTVGNYIGTNCKIRVKDYSNPDNVFAISAQPFTIKGDLRLNYPNGGGGQTLIAEEPLVVTWTPHGTIPTVKLEYTTTGAEPYTGTLVALTDGMTGSCATTVPSVIGTLIKIKVSDTQANRSRSDDSDNSFEVKGKLTLTSPVTRVSWVVGESYPITWTRNGPIANVRIDYTTNGWIDTNNIVTATAASTGSYSWNPIPPVISSTVRVKVSDALDSAVSSTSPVDFKLVGKIIVDEPTAASRWEVGVPATLRWTKTGPIDKVKIQLSKNSGPFTTIMTDVGGSTTSWTPLANSITPDARIRVVDSTDDEVYADSPSFHIKAVFNITSPGAAGGEVWPVDSDQLIAWGTVGGVNFVKIEYTTETPPTANWTVIHGSYSNSGSCPWNVDDAISNTCYIRISDVNDAEANAVSAYFRIRGAIILQQPDAAGISWTVGSNQQIIWTTSGTMDEVTIQYQYAAGPTWLTIATDVPATSSPYTWNNIPDHLSKQCKVKIFSEDDINTTDESTNTFTIRGELAVSNPTAATIWRVGDPGTIDWIRVAGNIQFVNIDYSINGGPFTNTIASDVQASLGTYTCSVPPSISNNIVVRVYDRDNTDVAALTPAFSIKAKLWLVRPIGNERFVALTNESIQWDYTGTIATVKLEYTINDGGNWTTINAGWNASLKAYTWAVANVLSSNFKVRVSNNADPNYVWDISPDPFKVVGTLSMISPGGGEVWSVGSNQSVTWSTGGTNVDKINIQYSTDRGVTFDKTIASEVTASLGVRNFTVDDTLSQQVVVKVVDTTEDTVFSTSSTTSFITIRGDLLVTRPALNDVFLIDGDEEIRWTRFGSITSADLSYSVAGGPWVPIATGVTHVLGADQSFLWSPVPNQPTLQAKIKVADNSLPLVVFNESPFFIIRGGFRITSPNSGA
ncbi:MAG: hypothetical protein PHT59_01005 [Candidatus Omnitrophica bacterium]|nr:hypothetical protein [Candidatus Omnitrophota bacterium]